MDQIILFLFLTISGAIIAFNIFLLIYFLKFKRKFTLIFKGKKIKDLEDVLLNQLEETKKQEKEIRELIARVKELENLSRRTFQKIGVIRFNPFSDIGGNQSFAIALLDNQDNGVVISSLFAHDSNRVYAKSIKAGKCDYPLSKEEQEALNRAMAREIPNPKS